MSNDSPTENSTKKPHFLRQIYGTKAPRYDLLTSLRMQKGWSIAELGSKSGIHRSNVSKIECFQKAPSTSEMVRLAKVFGLDSREIWPDREKDWWEKVRKKRIRKAKETAKAWREHDHGIDEQELERFY